MNFKYFSYLVQLASLIVLSILLVLVYKMNSLQDAMKQSEISRYQSINLAYELLQSSEDLTRMARSYAITRNVKYKQTYFDILAIRNGVLARPIDYTPAYWHLNQPASVSYSNNDNSKPVSLKSLMQAAKFTDEEINYLTLSQNNSDSLVAIEKMSFAIINDIKGELGDNYELHKKHDYAVDLLFNENYLEAKKHIMAPIKLVIDGVGERSAKEFENYQLTIRQYVDIIRFLIASSLAGVFLAFIYTAKKFVAPLQRLSQVDHLTGLFNRRHFAELAEQELIRSKRTARPLSLMMVDIDFFKNINDKYGHDVGDKTLVKLSELFRVNLREMDIFCRWGGEEFILLLTETDIETAYAIAERLRKSIENSLIEVTDKPPVRFTISIGLTSLKDESDTLDSIIKTADKLLYKSKKNGRNCVSKG